MAIVSFDQFRRALEDRQTLTLFPSLPVQTQASILCLVSHEQQRKDLIASLSPERQRELVQLFEAGFEVQWGPPEWVDYTGDARD